MTTELVRGWVTPDGDTDAEVLICEKCGNKLAIAMTERFGGCPIPNTAEFWGAIPVTINGDAKCYRCDRQL